ncbi:MULTISPECIES: hypothetical protein [Trichocoleus]|uniref:Uncharacterized protein n=1 Tax=Trichocoleus desertorum GB2-A4 TaxID=2933944 RepID=A0ABV0J9Q1_9CYAN|nr:hypothetical protein [Trichocoleus sp. FACHB-46]MBD1862183.1 hypothetical protein [Trichocoleus sp. FACHB-46]
MEEGHLTKVDWRCHIVVRLTAPATLPGSNTSLPVGAIGKGVAEIDYKANRVAFPIPNATALFLNLSRRHYEAARVAAQTFSSGPDSHFLADEDVFSYLEEIMASVVFAYTALEAFANEEIPDDFVYTIPKSKCSEVYNKVQIERSLSLRTKLGDILPAISGMSSPKGTKVWHDFVALEELRNNIIHMKTVDREHVGYSNQSIWSKLVNEPVPYVLPFAKAIVDYFYASRQFKPHWYEQFPS